MTAPARKLLVVEDDPGLQKQLRWCFDGYEVLTMGDRGHALEQVRRHQPPVVTLDLGLPPDPNGSSEGFATLEQILQVAPRTKVIVVTGNDDRENAVRAVGMGAYDFFNKPINAELLGFLVNRAYRMHELETENRRLLQNQQESSIDGVIACSAEMLKVCQTIEKVAPSDATILLLGESGTGKELCAQSVHSRSPRAANRFVAINCAAIPENLLESELFGYEKGAYTGAAKQTRGKIEYADSGTLFLDEIGDLPMALQAKLLRFLQERTFERIGGREEIPVDVRVVCATHQDLASKIQAGTFREDLFYRISEISVQIPPLRQRAGDTLLLARSFLDHFAREQGRLFRGFSKEALAAIENYPWPGNVRELKNRVKRATIMAEGAHIDAKDLELEVPTGEAATFNLREVRDQVERQTIVRALGHAGGKVTQAADLLGVSRPTMYDLIKKHGLKV
ncbi:MAG: PEP-CTERM-box response regulator transcription factor [Acidiferrobacterales bacterium]